MNRKKLSSQIESIGWQYERHTILKDVLISSVGEKEYAQVLSIYQKALEKLKNNLATLPIGYRYTGDYYIKKPYIIPAEFVKCNGSIFMREDLVSWQIESGYSEEIQKYYRNIYKEPREHSSLLTRDDGEPVFVESCKTAVAS